MKSITLRKPSKDQREKQVLLGLVELYLKMGKPIGSSTLQENGFQDLSSATIRNYFVKLEDEGYLKQQHSSGGRVPSPLAFRLYAQHHLSSPQMDEEEKKELIQNLSLETREIAGYLQKAAEKISEETSCALFLSAPRFDQDFVLDVRLIGVDSTRCLCALITDFGLIHTEVLYSNQKLNNASLMRIEAFLRFKITGSERPEMESEEEIVALRFYNEVMLRHIVNYTHFTSEEIYKTGFSKLLNYPDFNDTQALAAGLSLFENPIAMKNLLKECSMRDRLTCWIGDDLPIASCSVIAVPYRINQIPSGAIAILGPQRIPYRRLFAILETASECISESLTKSMYKFKLSFRQPEQKPIADLIEQQNRCLLIEDCATEENE